MFMTNLEMNKSIIGLLPRINDALVVSKPDTGIDYGRDARDTRKPGTLGNAGRLRGDA
jgi:hypothetical protein